MRAAIYTRVSTKKLKAVGDDPTAARDFRQNPDLQIEACLKFCAARGWDVVARFDDRMSGAKTTRPDLAKLMLAAHGHEFDCVVVWKTDRFARSVLHALQAINELAAKGVSFVSVTEPQVDMTTPMGRAMLTIIAVFAELERDITVERIRAGMASAKSRGQSVGRRRVAVPVLLAQQDLDKGMSFAAVARKHGVSRPTLYRALKAVTDESVQKGEQAGAA